MTPRVSLGGARRPAVFLDRDGVLNEPVIRNGKPYPPATLNDFVLLPGVEQACRDLVRAGYVLVVVTNQPDLARGTQDREVVHAMHACLRAALPVEAIYVCEHDDTDCCACRKPAPGMLERAALDLGLDLTRSVIVGDRWRDVEAGRRAGCHTVFVDRHYAERQPVLPEATVADLAAAVDWITTTLASGRRRPAPM